MSRPHRASPTAAAPNAKPAWAFRVRGEATEALEIDIYDTIGPSFWGESSESSAKGVRDALKANKQAKAITVRINSAGGDVVDGMAIYQLLAAHPAPVTVRIDALAASIASIVAMAGDEIVMADGAFMMIHNPWGGAFGEAADLRAHADLLDKMRAGLIDVYAARTGQPREDIDAALTAETWMTATEAKALGYATQVVPLKQSAPRVPAGPPAKSVASAWNLADFSRVPEAVKAAQRTSKTKTALAAEGDPMSPEQFAALVKALGLPAEATPEESIAAVEAMKPEEEPAAEGADKPPPPPPAEVAAKAALGRKVARLTGTADADAALGTIEGWKASHARAEQERAARAVADKAAEAIERDALVVELVKADPAMPLANAWADPLKATDTKNRLPAEPWASMPIARLKAYVANLGSRPAAMRPATLTSTPATGAVATSTDAALAAKYGVKPESAAWARDEMARAMGAGRG